MKREEHSIHDEIPPVRTGGKRTGLLEMAQHKNGLHIAVYSKNEIAAEPMPPTT
jgi:hypothetical protein